VTMLLSHAADGAAGATWPRRDVDVGSCWRQCCRVMLATALPGRHGRGAMEMLSHAGNNTIVSC
jgi:hypothetical protein